jgi:hypothetical protein
MYSLPVPGPRRGIYVQFSPRIRYYEYTADVTPNKFTKRSAFRITRLRLGSTSLIQLVTGSL